MHRNQSVVISINKRFRFLLQLCLIIGMVYFSGCSKKAQKSASRQTNASSATSRDPENSRETGGAYGRSTGKKSHGTKALALPSHEQKVKEFEARMKANARRDAKIAKEKQKPQYSDPSYFGHKKKPKKRPVGKRKFCKECGIVH